jgi:hypothetical protein
MNGTLDSPGSEQCNREIDAMDIDEVVDAVGIAFAFDGEDAWT